REATLFLHDPGWELHATKILVVRVGRLGQHVAEDRIRAPGLHLLDQVLTVDERLDFELARHGKGEHSHLFATYRFGLGGGLVRHGRFYDTVWREPELLQALGGGRWGRDGILPSLVPGLGAADQQDLTLLANDGLYTAATGRIFA